MPGLIAVDWLVIILYFILVFAVAAWAYIQERKDETAAGYFLAGRNVGWFVVGASLFASNIGSEHLIGLAGTGANSGVAVGQFEILASLVLLLLGWVFVPFYIKSGVYTMPEFLERRYSPAARWYLSIISIVGYVLTKISVTIYAGGIVFETLMGINFWVGAFIVVVITGIYTIMGGLRAVVYTDLIQMFVLIGGATAVTVIGLGEVGGWSMLRETAGPGFFNLWKPMTDPSFPWTGILFGAPILAVWYWCTDQFIVQRTLSAKNEDHARRGTIFAGYLKLLPLFIFVIPGVIAYVLAEQGQLELAQSDQALPALVGLLLPAGLRGLVVAGLLAALMSSLSSVFNSCSTLITWDIYKKMKPNATERRLVWVGRLATGALVVFGLLWIPFMQIISGRLYEYLQSVQAYIAPPIAAVFLVGILWRRINADGAITSLLLGFVLGTIRLILELANGADRAGLASGSIWEAIAEVNFLHFAIILFVVCLIALVGVSLLTRPPSFEQIRGLTYGTAEESELDVERDDISADLESDPAWRRVDVWLTIGVAIGVGLLWIYFTG
ncbi:MAG: sodium:solute symporter [Rhodothermales bacterium]